MRSMRVFNMLALLTLTIGNATCKTAHSAEETTSALPAQTSGYTEAAAKQTLPAAAAPAKVDTTAIPYRQIGMFKSPFGISTGVLVGPRHVLTAAHVLYDTAKQKPRTGGMVFIPGKSSDVNPFGTFALTKALITQEYADTNGQEWDFGMAILESPIGEKVGWMALNTDGSADKQIFNIAGYPAGDVNLMHICSSVVLIVGEQQLQHNCAGDPAITSGSGVYSFDPKTNRREIYGIHTSTGVVKPGASSGVYINKIVLATIQQWITENP